MEKLLYGKPYPDKGDKKALNTFLRIANLTYKCQMIHNVLFNIVMQSYPARALDRKLQVDWAKDAREGPKVLMSLKVDFGPMG